MTFTNDDAAEEAPNATVRLAKGVAIASSGGMALLSLWLFAISPDHPWRVETITLISLYAVVALAFLGGVRWALALSGREPRDRRDLIVGALPALAGPVILFVSVPASFGVLAAAFAAMGAWDSLSSYSGAVPVWYGRLRTQLTALIVLALMLAFVATS